MRAIRGLIAAALVAAAGTPGIAAGQNYFGQNHVQYDHFDWQIVETEHFLVYFYPEERRAAYDAARMAERAYARLSRVLGHQFREKKPIVLFASRSDFGQNNVTGDLGEGTGGVTEALRHRMLLNFTGDYRSFEHVLTHELVHAFQYDVFARGKAGNGLQALAEFMPPLWFAEGMAEYLSLGPSTTMTETWMRDAALNGRIPTVKEMTDDPGRFFPYRFGHSFWSYIGRRWGDEVIGQIMNGVPSVGVERSFRRELGMDLEDIGTEWREELQTTLLPQVGSLDRPRRFAQPLLTEKRSGGEIFLAPSLSPDGRHVAFLSNGSQARGQVFIDLWLGNGETGKRIGRLVKGTVDPDFEEFRLLYSQSAFSPDGRDLAFTAQSEGKDVLYILDVASRKVRKRIKPELEGVTAPSWSPDGRTVVVSGNSGGITDLYLIEVETGRMTALTDDRYGDLQPQWSPDGRSIAFATDRGAGASFDRLSFPHWQIAILDLATRKVRVIEGQAGLNINPQWAPDGRTLAYVSDRGGTANLFLYDLDRREHFRLTNVVGAVSAITEYSPAISWARGADRLAFTYFADGDYTVWTIANPRSLRGAAWRDPAPARTIAARSDSLPANPPTAAEQRTSESWYRSATGTLRASSDLPLPGDSTGRGVSIAALLDSADLALPDTNRFRERRYSVRFQPDYVARPSVGYAPDSYGRSVFGGTTLVMSDMLGNNHLAFSGEINGRMSEARFFLGYTNLGRRWQYSGGLSQSPYYFLSADSLVPTGEPGGAIEHQEVTVYIARQSYAVTAYPFNRFTRVELGGGFNNIDRRKWFVTREIRNSALTGRFEMDSIRSAGTLNYFDGQLALISDNTLFGYTGPLMGRRYRFQVSPVVGSFNWVEYLADYRRYDPIIFNYLTVATRLYANVSIGPDEREFPKYIARPDYVRGYDRNSAFYLTCPIVGANTSNCNAVQLLGSRVAVANVELRFPLIRRVELGILPIGLPPLDGVVFYDAGVAWSKDHTLSASRPSNFNVATQRYPVRSYGFGLRLNLFNYAILRWDYARPLDAPNRRGFWTWSLWPGF